MQPISSLPSLDGSRAQFAEILPILPDNGKPIARLHFDSLAELVSFIPDKAPPSMDEKRRYWDSKPDKDFFGDITTMAQAKKLASNGWQEGAERALPLLERVKIARPSKRTLSRYDVAGAVPSVGRYLAGNPLAMKTRQNSPTNQTPIITLISSTAAQWTITPDIFEALAITAAAIVDRLEDAGFRVEVIAGRRESSSDAGVTEATGENNAIGHRSEMFFRVKAAEDALDLPRLVFGIGHPSVHRRILFAAGDMHPEYKPSLGELQGRNVALDKPERPPGSYILPPLASLKKEQLSDPVAIFDRAVSQLKDQGCPGLE